jgi:hypothetical protein
MPGHVAPKQPVRFGRNTQSADYLRLGFQRPTVQGWQAPGFAGALLGPQCDLLIQGGVQCGQGAGSVRTKAGVVRTTALILRGFLSGPTCTDRVSPSRSVSTITTASSTCETPRLRSRKAARPGDGAQLGAVSFLHRFGSALHPHFHFHVVVLDGVFRGRRWQRHLHGQSEGARGQGLAPLSL